LKRTFGLANRHQKVSNTRRHRNVPWKVYKTDVTLIDFLDIRPLFLLTRTTNDRRHRTAFTKSICSSALPDLAPWCSVWCFLFRWLRIFWTVEDDWRRGGHVGRRRALAINGPIKLLGCMYGQSHAPASWLGTVYY
jgi:hypothetical protein